MPAIGATPKLLLRFDDPAAVAAARFATDGTRFYFTIAQTK